MVGTAHESPSLVENAMPPPLPTLRPDRCDFHVSPRLHLGERLHVAERLGEDVAGRGEARLVALRDRRAAVAERYAGAFRPERNLARRHHRAGALLARQRHRGLEVDLLAPGHGRGGERQCRRDRLRGWRVKELGIEGERAEIETDALRHGWPRFPETTPARIESQAIP